MNKTLEAKILSCRDLPSPPIVAARIVDQCQDDCLLSDIVNIVSDDVAISVKLLRLANSAAYRGSQPCVSVLAAVTRLGVNVSVMTALSFSLANTLKAGRGSDLDHEYLWRRSVTAAAVARFLANRANLENWEECFLAALVQDIGMLAADCALSDIYTGLVPYAQHEYAQLAEYKVLNVDHSKVGASLLRHWRLPPSIVDAVEQSHSLERLMKRQPSVDYLWCVAYSGVLADAVLLSDELELARAIAFGRASMGDLAGHSESEFTHALFAAVKDAEQLFETSLVPNLSDLAESSKSLMFDYMIGHQHPAANDEQLFDLKNRVEELEEENRRDILTGAYNRLYFDEVLDGIINDSIAEGKPLSLMFIDADRFKQVNDVHGHQVGDEVLKWLANMLRAHVREADVIVRYGGEEFVVILPALTEEDATALGKHIVQTIQESPIDVNGLGLGVTVSIGVATMASSTQHLSSRELVVAADQAMYFSKKTGRNKCSPASALPQQRSA
ncbi:MAG: diguanylate cyclase [Pseudomonadales bacterium]